MRFASEALRKLNVALCSSKWAEETTNRGAERARVCEAHFSAVRMIKNESNNESEDVGGM